MEELIYFDPEFEKFCWDEFCKARRSAKYLGMSTIEDFNSFKDTNASVLKAVFDSIATKRVVH